MNKDYLLKFRRLIGIGCICLVPVCLLTYFLFGTKIAGFIPYVSLSSLYWTNVRIIYISAFAILGIFYAIYDGYGILDKILSIATAICIVGTLIFPLASEDVLVHNFTFMFNLFPNMPHNISCIFHKIFSMGLFAIQDINLAFVFTKTDGVKTEQKKLRNKIYITTAIIIACLFLALFINMIGRWLLILCIFVQTISFILLGICWLIKGETFSKLNDK